MPKIAASLTAVKASRRPRRCAPVYRVRNWAAYEAGLKQRGSLTLMMIAKPVSYPIERGA